MSTPDFSNHNASCGHNDGEPCYKFYDPVPIPGKHPKLSVQSVPHYKEQCTSFGGRGHTGTGGSMNTMSYAPPTVTPPVTPSVTPPGDNPNPPPPYTPPPITDPYLLNLSGIVWEDARKDKEYNTDGKYTTDADSMGNRDKPIQRS